MTSVSLLSVTEDVIGLGSWNVDRVITLCVTHLVPSRHSSTGTDMASKKTIEVFRLAQKICRRCITEKNANSDLAGFELPQRHLAAILCPRCPYCVEMTVIFGACPDVINLTLGDLEFYYDESAKDVPLVDCLWYGHGWT